MRTTPVAVALVASAALCWGQVMANQTLDIFKTCKIGKPGFDSCVMNGLNTMQTFFNTGLRQYNIGSFDPFFVKEVSQKRGGTNMNYQLKLKNVYERGWTKSHVTKFRSDPRNYMIKYSQFFPDKYVEGDYEIVGNVFDYPLNNKGRLPYHVIWDISLLHPCIWNGESDNYTQTTTAVRRPYIRGVNESQSGTVKVKIHQDSIGDMKLHITNILKGRAALENVIDSLINVGWRPFLPIVKPLIDDLVSTAFTDIFDKYFQNFPFQEIFTQ